jgi:hypothetical protein
VITIGGSVAAAFAALLLAGCGSNTGDSSGTASARPSSAPPTTTFTMPAPVSYGRATFVTSRGTFDLKLGTVTTDPDGTGRQRGGKVTSSSTANDPRATVTCEDTWETNAWGKSGATGPYADRGLPGSFVQWGTSHCTNAGGTWDGSFAGLYTTATTDIITWWYRGGGGYKGWSMVSWIDETPSGVGHALIFPGDIPPTLDTTHTG